MTVRPVSKPLRFQPGGDDEVTRWWCTDCQEQVPHDHVCMVVSLERSLRAVSA